MGLQQGDGFAWAGLWYSLLEIHYCVIWHNVHFPEVIYWLQAAISRTCLGFGTGHLGGGLGSKKFRRWHLMWKFVWREAPCSGLPPVDSKVCGGSTAHCTSYCTLQGAATELISWNTNDPFWFFTPENSNWVQWVIFKIWTFLLVFWFCQGCKYWGATILSTQWWKEVSMHL